ncbi:MAG: hypothetical protein ABL940_00355 [Bacteroidia bacterium]
MKTKLFTAALLLCVCANSYAQDKLFKPDGTYIEVQLIEVTPLEIKYKKWAVTDSPLYTINKTDALLILYKNGESELIKTATPTANKATKDTLKIKYGQDMLSFNVLSPFFNSLQLSYEHFNTKGNLSVKIPVTINYSYANFNIGIDFKCFPTRQGAVRYFIAPCFRVGYKENQQYGMRTANSDFDNNPYIAALLSNGLSVQATPYLNITVDAGLGAYNAVAYNYNTTGVEYQLGVHIGYRL